MFKIICWIVAIFIFERIRNRQKSFQLDLSALKIWVFLASSVKCVLFACIKAGYFFSHSQQFPPNQTNILWRDPKRLFLFFCLSFSYICSVILLYPFLTVSVHWHAVLWWLSKFCWMGLIVLTVWVLILLLFLILNT